MITTLVQTAKAVVLAIIATELAFDAAKAIQNRMNLRKQNAAWETYVTDADLPLVYDPVSTTVL